MFFEGAVINRERVAMARVRYTYYEILKTRHVINFQQLPPMYFEFLNLDFSATFSIKMATKIQKMWQNMFK